MLELPETKSEYWTDSDVNKTDLVLAGNQLCKEHEVEVDIPRREAICKKCPFGFRFRVDQVALEGEYLKDIKNNKNYKVLNIKK